MLIEPVDAEANYRDALPIALISRLGAKTLMTRIGRIIVAGFAHHVTQCGDRRKRVFFESSDGAFYRDLRAERLGKSRR